MTKKLFVSTVALTFSLTYWDSITSLADTQGKTTPLLHQSQKRDDQQSESFANDSIMNQKIHIEAALAYAQTWWNKRNPDYKIWDPSDCANYVSQILKAGGLKENRPSSITFGGIDSNQDYWYSKKEGDTQFTVSRTWINVEDFYTYWSKTQRVIQPEKLDMMRDIEVGDVVQLQSKSGGRYSHIMFVVQKDMKTIYLTGHTNDREALDMQTIQDAYRFRVIKFS